mmetsp:Transcript_45199/g.105801  ORF Transcript_45199/g.105801 Transcript_45199/m.105801 type:complete len:97 (+) Transcript_45199:196-486(+)
MRSNSPSPRTRTFPSQKGASSSLSPATSEALPVLGKAVDPHARVHGRATLFGVLLGGVMCTISVAAVAYGVVTLISVIKHGGITQNDDYILLPTGD